MQWQSCPPEPLAWFPLRELGLLVLNTPALLLPLVALLALALAALCQLPRSVWPAVALITPLVLSVLYTPLATAVLSAWLTAQLPAPAPMPSVSPVLVLLGRGPAIAAASTSSAAAQLRRDPVLSAYVSGDARSTAERLVQLGVAPSRIAGDSCARTTWENATRTAAWLRQHHPGVPVLLITDPWQLPRASRAFARQGLQVHPLAAEPPLTAPERNRLALREAAATVLYRLQGRM
jgi:uncharacterized SAM-binding protein YcdF (DUF218 family)